MKIPFYKYQGTGNDFVLIDNRGEIYLTKKDTARIRLLCDRKFGIGADGLILLQDADGFDFEMVYFNADGSQSSMCGNGGRCIAAFAKRLGIIDRKCTFLAIDGAHEAIVHGDNSVELKMGNVDDIEVGEDYFILDTGSPHYVIFVEDVDDINVVEGGQAIRYGDRFRKEGINVNFVEITKDKLLMATYERGVEDETLSCGTGVVAAAISFFIKNKYASQNEIAVSMKGGELKVKLKRDGDGFVDIWLCGPTEMVFRGEFEAVP
ncbi:MAG TPA: diaminopimelate epimerase [Bacteroidetes bacterium]|nr:diaminopimelate epimerase [Bacteroidota bacterium]